jgi:hypothetical protein
LKSKFSPLQHGFIKSNSTTTNLFAYLDSISLAAESQRQVDAIQFPFSIALDPVPHALFIPKYDAFELSPTTSLDSTLI